MLDYVGVFVLGVFFGMVLMFFVREKWLEHKIARLTDENSDLSEALYSFQQKERNQMGLQAKRDKAERQAAMMLEFAELAKQPNANVQEVIKVVAAKYPDLALDLVKKGLKI